jgi:hypothetical protein
MLPNSRKYALRLIVPGTGAAVGAAEATDAAGAGGTDTSGAAPWLGGGVATDRPLPLMPLHAASDVMDTSSVTLTSRDFLVEPFICVAPCDSTLPRVSRTLDARGHEVIAVT